MTFASFNCHTWRLQCGWSGRPIATTKLSQKLQHVYILVVNTLYTAANRLLDVHRFGLSGLFVCTYDALIRQKFRRHFVYESDFELSILTFNYHCIFLFATAIRTYCLMPNTFVLIKNKIVFQLFYKTLFRVRNKD